MEKFSWRKYNNMVDFSKYEPLEPLDAIRAKCLDCCCYDMNEVKQCDLTTCPLNRFISINWIKEKKTRKPWSEERRKKFEENKNK